MTDDKQTDRVR